MRGLPNPASVHEPRATGSSPVAANLLVSGVRFSGFRSSDASSASMSAQRLVQRGRSASGSLRSPSGSRTEARSGVRVRPPVEGASYFRTGILTGVFSLGSRCMVALDLPTAAPLTRWRKLRARVPGSVFDDFSAE